MPREVGLHSPVVVCTPLLPLVIDILQRRRRGFGKVFAPLRSAGHNSSPEYCVGSAVMLAYLVQNSLRA